LPTRLFSFLLALVVLSLPGIAQVFDMEKDRVTMTVLDGPMRFHTGDDADDKLGRANPGFDDSSRALAIVAAVDFVVHASVRDSNYNIPPGV
jgi:hypothetical protein